VTADRPRKRAGNVNDQGGARCPDLPKVLWGKCQITASLIISYEREETEVKIRRWRQVADECRAMAADTKGPQGRQNLLDLARAYDEMADRAQESLGQP
jgi:hypothetical protein